MGWRRYNNFHCHLYRHTATFTVHADKAISGNNGAKLDGNQNPAGTNAVGPNGDDYVFYQAAPDYGDAPDPPYQSLLASNGSRHLNWSYEWLGNLVDGECERKANDNDDGVMITWLKEEPLTLRFTVNIKTSGEAGRYDTKKLYLNAWVDWNNDGDWNDADEQILTGKEFSGPAEPSYDRQVPAGVDHQNIGWARFRLSYDENVSFEGTALYGEVEDYKIKGPPYSKAEPKTITIPIPEPEEGRNSGAFTTTVYNPTDHAIKVKMSDVIWIAAGPEDTTVSIRSDSVDVPEGGISTPINFPGFSVGPEAEVGTFPCDIPWTVTTTSSAYGTVNVDVGFKFNTDPTLVLTKSVGGIVVPIDKLALLAPYIGLSSIILVATAIYFRRVKRRKEVQ